LFHQDHRRDTTSPTALLPSWTWLYIGYAFLFTHKTLLSTRFFSAGATLRPSQLESEDTITESFCAGTKIVSDTPFVHTQNADFGTIFCTGAMLLRLRSCEWIVMYQTGFPADPRGSVIKSRPAAEVNNEEWDLERTEKISAVCSSSGPFHFTASGENFRVGAISYLV